MPISRTEDLFTLIKSLSKSEKRAFRLYVERIAESQNLVYMKIFDAMDQQKVLNEPEIKRKIKSQNSTSYSNAKRHLYEQLMISLRLIQKSKKANIKVRELIDFCYILYDKGLYLQTLKILERAKYLAHKNHLDFALLTLLELEKTIHSRHITRTPEEPVEYLLDEVAELGSSINERISSTNLKLHLHKYYINHGHVRSEEEERIFVARYQDEVLQGFRPRSAIEKVTFRQTLVWYYYILNDFHQCFHHASKWIDAFESDTELLHRDINLLLRGYHYALTGLFSIRDHERHGTYLQRFEKLCEEQKSKLSENSFIIRFMYLNVARLDHFFLRGDFVGTVNRIKRIERQLQKHEYASKMDQHKIKVINYKIAWSYLGQNKASTALSYLLAIVEDSKNSLRKDIQIYSRIMILMCYYDMDMLARLHQSIVTFKKYFNRVSISTDFQDLSIKMFRALLRAGSSDQIEIFKEFHEKFEEIKKDRFEKRSFIYLDIENWMLSKIKKQSLSQLLSQSL